MGMLDGGGDLINLMMEGMETYVKDHIRDELVERLVSEFKADITSVIDEQLSEMVFKGFRDKNHQTLDENVKLLIEWTKGQAEYKKKYTVQSEIVE